MTAKIYILSEVAGPARYVGKTVHSIQKMWSTRKSIKLFEIFVRTQVKRSTLVLP